MDLIKYDKSLKNIYLYKILFMNFFIDSILYIYLLSLGFKMFDIFLSSSVSSLVGLILEIPTGSYADKHGPKSSMILSTISFIIANIIFILMDKSFFLLMFASVMIGIFKNFLSGSDSAYIYLVLQKYKLEKKYLEFKGDVDSKLFYVTAIFGSMSGFMYSISNTLPFYISILFATFSLYFLLKCEDIVEMQESKCLDKSYSEIMLKGFEEVLNNAEIKWFILFTIFMTFILNSIIQTYPLYFRYNNLPTKYFGVIYSFFYIVSGISSKYAYKFKNIKTSDYSKLVICLVMLLMTVIMLRFDSVYFAIFIFIPRFVIGVYPVMVQQFINDRIDNNRVTILSIREFAKRLSIIVFMPILGYIIDRYGLKISYLYIIVFSLISIFILIILKEIKIKNIRRAD